MDPPNLIRPLDIVRLRHSHEWRGGVVAIEVGLALVMPCDGPQIPGWFSIDLLELDPGQEEWMAA